MFGRLRFHLFVQATALLALMAMPAQAAQLIDIQGKVLVNRGTGFQRAIGMSELQPGDRVMATGGGSARIVYSAACSATVSSGTAVIVRAKAPCAGGDASTTNVPTDTLVIGALVAGGVAAGAFALGGHGSSSSSPASP